MIQIEEKEILKGIDESYKKAGSNAYFGNGFQAGVDFALKKVKNLTIPVVMPRISHFVSEIGQKYPANDEAVLIEIQDGYLRFYEIGYDFERIYLTPVYVA